MKIVIYSMLIMQVFIQCRLNAQASIPNSVIGCGASEMSSTNLKLVGTIGQTIIGLTSGSNIFNAQGFWQAYRSRVVKTNDFKATSFTEVILVPNPIRSTGTLWFDIDEAQEFNIRIVNMMGVEVRNLGQRSLFAGRHGMTLDLSDLSGGIYYIILNNQYNDMKIPFIKVD